MWNSPTKNDLQNIPALYETEEIEVQEKMIHMHFFLGGCDWYVSEYQEENQIFFGYPLNKFFYVEILYGHSFTRV